MNGEARISKIGCGITLLIWVLAAGGARSQTQIDLRTQSKSVDFRSAISTFPAQTGSVLPSACAIGALYFLTTAPAGANLFVCASTSTWSVVTDGSSTNGQGAPSGTCTIGSLYDDTINSNNWFCADGQWQVALTTTGTGPFVLTGQNGSVPVAPSTGNTSMFFNSFAKVPQSIDDTGNAATMVRPTDCSASGQAVQTIHTDGSITCGASGLHAIGYTYDGGGSVLVSGVTKYLTVPFACTIDAWDMAVDTGAATMRIWKAATGSSIPTASNSISTSGLSLSSGTAIHSSAVSDFTTTTVNADDILGFNLYSVSSATFVNFILECVQ